MSSSIGSISSYTSSVIGTQRSQHLDTSKLAKELFAQLDTSGKGYLQASDLESAFSSVTSSSSTTSADEVFTSLDSNSDGKVTQEELTRTLQSLMDSLTTLMQNSRLDGARADQGGMPPPPPPEGDTGFTKSELQAQLDEIGTSDSKRSTLISDVVNNFSAADTNGDGKVTFKEAMTYEQSSAASTSATSSTADASSTNEVSDLKTMLQLLKLADAYGLFDTSSASTVSAVA